MQFKKWWVETMCSPAQPLKCYQVRKQWKICMKSLKKTLKIWWEKSVSTSTQQIITAISERVKCPPICLPCTKWRLVWHWEGKIHLHLDKWSSEHYILYTVYARGLSWENWSSYLFGQLPEEMQLCCNMWCSWKEKYAMNGKSHLHLF